MPQKKQTSAAFMIIYSAIIMSAAYYILRTRLLPALDFASSRIWLFDILAMIIIAVVIAYLIKQAKQQGLLIEKTESEDTHEKEKGENPDPSL